MNVESEQQAHLSMALFDTWPWQKVVYTVYSMDFLAGTLVNGTSLWQNDHARLRAAHIPTRTRCLIQYTLVAAITRFN